MADLIENVANYTIRGVELAEAEYYEQLIKTLDRIEKEVVSLVGKKLPLDNQQRLFELKAAIAVRPLIKQTLEKEYLAWSDTVVRKGYNKQAKRIEKAFKTIGNIPTEFQQLTKSDLILVQNLKVQSFTQFKDISNTFTRTLSEKVYQYTLLNADPLDLEKELRQSINGIYASADDKEIDKLVKSIKEDEIKIRKMNRRSTVAKKLRQKIDKNVQILQSKYASDRAGENMKRYAGQLLNDSLRQFHAQLNFAKSKDAGLTFVKYFGSVIPTTRDHCRDIRAGRFDKRKGGLFTIDEVRKLWQRSWKGKQTGDPLIVRGGYNCRHQWSFVNPDWYDKAGNLIIE